MGKFMGFCKGGRVRFAAAAGAAAALCFFVLCVAGTRSYAAEDHAWIPRDTGGTLSLSGVSAGVSAAAGSTQVVISPDLISDDDDLQIVLSMGELPESICISWKGEADGPACIKIGCSRKALRKVKAVKASSEKTLEGSYYRYRVQFDGLEPGEKYYYAVGSFEGDDSGQGRWVRFGKVHSFRVPKASESTQFLYLGDVQFDVSPVMETHGADPVL